MSYESDPTQPHHMNSQEPAEIASRASEFLGDNLSDETVNRIIKFMEDGLQFTAEPVQQTIRDNHGEIEDVIAIRDSAETESLTPAEVVDFRRLRTGAHAKTNGNSLDPRDNSPHITTVNSARARQLLDSSLFDDLKDPDTTSEEIKTEDDVTRFSMAETEVAVKDKVSESQILETKDDFALAVEALFADDQEIVPTRHYDVEDLNYLFASIESEGEAAREELHSVPKPRVYFLPTRTDRMRSWIRKKTIQASNIVETVGEKLNRKPVKVAALVGGVAIAAYAGYKFGFAPKGANTTTLAQLTPKNNSPTTLLETAQSIPVTAPKSDKIQQWYDVYHQYNPNMSAQQFRDTVSTQEFIDSWNKFFTPV